VENWIRQPKFNAKINIMDFRMFFYNHSIVANG